MIKFIYYIVPLLLLLAVEQGFCKHKTGWSNLTPDEREWLIFHRGHIRYAPSPNYPPIGFINENGKYDGLSADYIKIIEEKYNIKFKIIHCSTWSEIIEKVKKGEIDVVGNIQETSDRQAFLRFTKPYISIPNTIVVRKDHQGTLNLGQMAGMKVAVVSDYATAAYIQKHQPNLSLSLVPDNPTGLQMVSFGRTDAMITDLAVASYFIEKLGISNLRVAGNIDFKWKLSFATRRDWPLFRTILDKGLSEIPPDKKEDLFRKWIQIGDKDHLLKRRFFFYLGTIASIALTIILGIFVWNRTLQRQVFQRTIEIQKELKGRKQAEEALRLSYQRFETVLNSLDSMICVTDMDSGQILFQNRQMQDAQRLFHSSGSSLYRQDQALQEERRIINLTNNMNTNLSDYRVWQEQDRNGSGKWYIHHERIIRWTDKRLVNLHIATEITKLKNMEKEIRQSQKLQSIGTLASGIAHDFNNILAYILGFGELLKIRCADDTEALKDIQEILTAGLRARELVKQILTFSRQTEIERLAIDILPVLKESIKLLKATLPATIEIVDNVNLSECVIKADPTQMHQIIINLITNAAHAIRNQQGKIDLSLENVFLRSNDINENKDLNEGSYALLTVTDNGHGIAENDLDQIFDPFFTTKAIGEGTGLGLSVVHGIVKEMNGVIVVNSAIGHGTTVKIYFPLSKAKIFEYDFKSISSQKRKENVLFMDDEKVVNHGQHIDN